LYFNKKVSIVIPAYNEEKLIKRTIESVPDFIDLIIVIDDKSKDSTYAKIKTIKRHFGKRLFIIQHDVNKGVGAAIVSGYKESLKQDCDIAVVMAGDAQMDPKYLPDLLDPIVEGRADYTKGNRLEHAELEKMPKVRQRGNAILSILTKVSSGYWDIVDPQNGYAAISTEALRTIDLDSIYPRYGYCNDVLVKLNIYNFRVLDVPMPPVYGEEKSGIRIKTYTFHMSRLLTGLFFHRIRKKFGGLKFHPLLLFYTLGLLLLSVGVAMGIWIVGLRLISLQATEGTLILTTLFVLTGLQLFLFAMLFDVLTTRAAIEGRSSSDSKGKNGSVQVSFHPTIIGLFRRFSSKFWGGSFHPIALIYMFGTVFTAVGLLLGVYILYLRIFDIGVSFGTEMIAALLIIAGFQFIFFGMVFEILIRNR